jgi:hypothetical protein
VAVASRLWRQTARGQVGPLLHLAPIAMLLSATLPVRGALGQLCGTPDSVPREEILQAMKAHGAYSLTTTTNAARFGAEVLLAIARRRQQESTGSTLFLIRQSDWFAAHQATAGVTYEEMSIAAREGYEHNQDVLVAHGANVVDRVEEGPAPLMALDVKVFWPESKQRASKYSYKDTLSIPRVLVYNERVIRFKLLQYEDMVVFDKIEGISVRPIGFFSALFKIIGNPDLRQNRIAVSADEWQVMRGRVKAFLGISDTRTATFEPDGRGHEGIPTDRADLKAIENRLKRSVKLRYQKSQC